MNMSSVLNGTGELPYKRWDLPELSDSPGTTSVQKSNGNQQQDYKEGFERGHREGQEAGRQAIANQVASLEQLLCNLSSQLEELDQAVEEELLALALAVGRELAGREISTHPEQVVALVRKAVAVLPSASRDIRIRLHPEDVRLVRELLSEPGGNRQWELIDDATLKRGGCQVSTETSQVDASVETRLNTIMTALNTVVNLEEGSD